ncbi:MAG: agmatine deiminase family protein [Bacteroidales bacterium]|nr:agmatine deiminase family protein [Bacteroidales bacterium]
MSPWEEELRYLIGKDFVPTSPPAGPVRNVAEFEQMQGVLIRYPFGISFQVIAELAGDINVVTIVESISQQTYVLDLYSANGVNTANCSFLIASSDSYWTRDYGPWYIFDGNDEPGIVDFPYNRPRPNDDEIPIEMADYLGINLFGMNVIHTGGNYMTDGYGISSSSELVWEENPSLSHSQIDQAVLNYLGIETYHVVPDPNNTYIDHIDCWGKFLDVDKVLIREVPSTHAQYDEIEATAAYYASQNSSYETPFQVFRVYTPNDQPYTNSLILNKKVLVPITGSSWDDDALQAYEEAMPGYEVIGFTGSWESTDALHCRTKGIADVGMLFIRHLPLLGYQPVQADYQIQADITAHSGQAIYADSVFIIYSTNGAPYDTTLMAHIGGKSYSGTISGLEAGSEVSYYLYAADQSGRNATHPFIGEPDPHVFYAGAPSYQDIAINPTNVEVNIPTEFQQQEELVISNLGQLSLDFSIIKQYMSKSSKAYCAANGGNSDEYIQQVLMGSIVNTTGQSYYGDYTHLSTEVNAGESYNLTIVNGEVWNEDDLGVWIDWNQDEDFEDADENVVCESNNGGEGTFEIVIPNHALSGTATMRIRIKYYGEDCGSSCGSTTYGEVEDYTLEVNNNFVDWLGVNPTSGSIPGTEETNIGLTFNSSGLEEGDYFAELTINSNDPDEPLILVPVHLIVSDARFVNLHVLLEGPFIGSEMSTSLNALGYLPLNQPFGSSPWDYSGTEHVSAIPNSDVTDWILVEFRDAPTASQANSSAIVSIQAAFLLKNGAVVDLDGISNLPLVVPISEQLFTVIHHRNHLSILSADALVLTGNIYSCDFTSDVNQAFGENSQVELKTGTWGMISGDIDASGEVDLEDILNIWANESGERGYLPSDLNMDGQVNNQDKNDFWFPENGNGSQLP